MGVAGRPLAETVRERRVPHTLLSVARAGLAFLVGRTLFGGCVRYGKQYANFVF